MNALPAIISAEGVEINIPQEFELVSINFSEGIFDDITIHDFLIEKLLPKRPSALIIPASLGSLQTGYWGFRIGMHIRLTKELGDLRYIPLIFVSEDSLEEILITQDEKLAVLCSTPGSILVSNDANDITTALRILKPIDSVDYKNKVLKAITINRPESTGKHSLANVWGVSRLAKATGLQNILLGKEDIANRFKELYVKYLESLNEAQSVIEAELKLPDLVKINTENKQVLLIDDEADNGWGDVLKPLFKGNLTCISGKGKSFEEFYEEAQTVATQPIWDLILLDLRLDPKEDQAGNELKMAKEYSGAKLLAYIKKHNAGQQVIMFTASNKAWNMQQLLDMKADGYYVKESPEFDQSKTFSILTYNSFAGQANACFEKSYLKQAYTLVESIKKLLYLTDKKLINGQGAIVAFLNQGYNTLYQATLKKQEFYLYAFLDFYKIIELLGKELIEGDHRAGFTIKGKKSSKYLPIPFIKFTSPLEVEIEPIWVNSKIESFKINKYIPLEKYKRFYEIPTSSTRFCGLMLLRLKMAPKDTIAFMILNKLRNDLTHEGNTTARVSSIDVLDILRLIERAFKEI